MTDEIVAQLNKAKKQKGYTLAKLAEQSGITLGTVNKIMSGELKKINPDKLKKLADALDVSVESLTCRVASQEENLGLVKVACISPQMEVGNCEFNVEQIVQSVQKAHQKGVKIALFPELCITGYTCYDLFFQQTLQQSALQGLENICQSTKDCDTIVVVGLPFVGDNGKLYNVGAVVLHGEVLGIVPKINLPNYNEFYEKRLFACFEGENTTATVFGKQVPFGSKIIFADGLCKELRFALEICEDIWVSDSPSISHAKNGANVILNLSASSETVVKQHYRQKLVEIQSGKLNVGYAYCSAGPDESTSTTVFSAHNIICENGECLAYCEPFTTGYCQAEIDVNFIENERSKLDHSAQLDSGYCVVKFELPVIGASRVYPATPFVPTNKKELNERCEKALTMQAYALKKRLEHTHTNKLVIGVSGGSDSTLALLACSRALKLANRPNSDIVAITMPCFGTTQRTLDNSVALAKAIGATVMKIDISASVTQHLKDINHDISVTNTTYENAQARERTQVLMDIANDVNGLVVGTGDMSELALGWATFNGDQMSMYGINSSISKTFVKAIINYVAEQSAQPLKGILLDVLDTPISPELLPKSADGTIAQITEDAVGPYELHDYFIYLLLRKCFTPSKVFRLAQLTFAGKYDDETIYKWEKKFISRFFAQHFKRSCSPDGIKMGSVDLGKYSLIMPSDASAKVWLADLEKVAPSK